MDDLGPDPRWTLARYYRECEGRMDVGRSSAIAVDGDNLFMYDRNNFQHDAALDARKRRWAVLRMWCTGILLDAHFANISFIQCKQKVPCYPALRDAIDTKMEIKDGDSQLQ